MAAGACTAGVKLAGAEMLAGTGTEMPEAVAESAGKTVLTPVACGVAGRTGFSTVCGGVTGVVLPCCRVGFSGCNWCALLSSGLGRLVINFFLAGRLASCDFCASVSC